MWNKKYINDKNIIYILILDLYINNNHIHLYIPGQSYTCIYNYIRLYTVIYNSLYIVIYNHIHLCTSIYDCIQLYTIVHGYESLSAITLVCQLLQTYAR